MSIKERERELERERATERDRETDRERETETERQRQRETERQRERTLCIRNSPIRHVEAGTYDYSCPVNKYL